MTDIGKRKDVVIVEPLWLPWKRGKEAPVEEPVEEPRPEREPEKEPVGV
jgi:hypothetical protein